MATDQTIAKQNIAATNEEYNLMGPPNEGTVPFEPDLKSDSSINMQESISRTMEFGTPLDDETIISSQQEDAATLRRSNRRRTPTGGNYEKQHNMMT